MQILLSTFIKRIRAEYSEKTPTRSQLEVMGQELKALCAELVFDKNTYRPANSGEELLYELSVDTNDGPSIYLVSDGVGVDTVPHEHQTWAIIVGIHGEEFNIFYEPTQQQDRQVSILSERCISKGDVLVMEPHQIHAIDSSRGSHPTYHIHLYGRALASLPSYNSRCYAK